MTDKDLVTRFLLVAATLLLWLPIPLHCAEQTDALLESITFERKSGTEETVTFQLNGPHIPKIFAIKGEAPKIVFDFYDTSPSPSIKGMMKGKGNLITAIRTGVHKDGQHKTRVVLDLAPAEGYDFSQDFQENKNILRITVFRAQRDNGKQKNASPNAKIDNTTQAADDAAGQAPPPAEKKEAAPVTAAEEQKVEPPPAAPPAQDEKSPEAPPSSAPTSIHAISFEDQHDQGEKVSFQLNNFHPPTVIGIEEGTPQIVCDFTNAVLAGAIPEIIPASGTFIQQVRVEKDGNASTVRVVLELVPNHHYDLQQFYFKEKDQYVLWVKSADKSKKKTDKTP